MYLEYAKRRSKATNRKSHERKPLSAVFSNLVGFQGSDFGKQGNF